MRTIHVYLCCQIDMYQICETCCDACMSCRVGACFFLHLLVIAIGILAGKCMV